MIRRLRQAIALLLLIVALGVASCGGNDDVPVVLMAGDDTQQANNPLVGALAEVSPPERIQQLKPYLDVYEPQVRIAAPRDNETINSTSVQVELSVRDLPIYKDQTWNLGPHLQLFLDDEPYQVIYATEIPITLSDLAPGTHTLRVLAARPWDESFKNEGAYDQVTFNVFTTSSKNNPDRSQALLTYSQPQGHYGAEPIMLDFYLTNVPLHLVAQADESSLDWRLRCTVNGESFIFDRWQPIYLKGFQPGKNWLKLELIDENGNLIDNAFNSGIRVIEYAPGGEDSLAKLMRGEIPLDQAKGLIDPNYEPPLSVTQPLAKPQPEASPTPDTAPPLEPETPVESGAAAAEPPTALPAPEADDDAIEVPAALPQNETEESAEGDRPQPATVNPKAIQESQPTSVPTGDEAGAFNESGDTSVKAASPQDTDAPAPPSQPEAADADNQAVPAESFDEPSPNLPTDTGDAALDTTDCPDEVETDDLTPASAVLDSSDADSSADEEMPMEPAATPQGEVKRMETEGTDTEPAPDADAVVEPDLDSLETDAEVI